MRWLSFITFHFVCFGWIFFKCCELLKMLTNMIYQITHDFSFSVWGAFYNNYKSVLCDDPAGSGPCMRSMTTMLINDCEIEKVPLAGYLAAFFIFVIVYGFFKSSEPVMPIYLQF